MSNFISESVKRPLRESWLTRGAYRKIGELRHFSGRLRDRVQHGRFYPQSYFDRIFCVSRDYWSYEGDEVSEFRKKRLLELVQAQGASSVLEIGCASGWITMGLGPLAASVTATDISPRALSQAQERCKNLDGIKFKRVDVLSDELPGTFELVMCAGVLVYLPWEAQLDVAKRIKKAMVPGGLLLLEHTRDAFVAQVAGRDVHELYVSDPDLALIHREAHDNYEILLLELR